MVMISSLRSAAFLTMVVGGLCAVAGGCGSSKPSPVPVKGVVTLDGKAEWPVEGTIFFYPVGGAEGFPSIPGTADFDRQGGFVAETHKPGDGLYPGEYQVQFKVWKVRPTMEAPVGVSLLPERFGKYHTSGVTITVPAKGGVPDLTIPVESK